MRSFIQLYIATVREFVRDTSALFWTLAFPIMFIIIFGIIFSGDEGDVSFSVGLVNEDGAASQQLVDSLKQIEAFEIHTGSRDKEIEALKDGDRRAVIVIPAGTGEQIGEYKTQLMRGGGTELPQANLEVYYDPSDTNRSQIVLSIVDKVVSGMNVGVSGITPVLTIDQQKVKIGDNDLSNIDYLLPGILAMSLMQMGLFGTAAPLVSLREKGVLRRMGATPLSRSSMLASQIVFRLTTAFVQTALIVIVGSLLFDVNIQYSNLVQIVGVVLLGSGVFITLGYFLAGLAKTEEAIQGIVSLPNFVFMFLSGIFFPVEMMPDWIRPLVDVIPLTYLGDLLRRVMIDAGSYYSPARSLIILAGWLAVCGVLALRFFRWESQS